VIVILGESDNDRAALAELVRALCPDARIKVLRRPLVLIKGVRSGQVPKNADLVAEAVRATAVREAVTCVFAHEDADDVEPNDEAIAERIRSALVNAGTPGDVHAVVPAWELEAWWFLWPGIVAACYQRWVAPNTSTPPGQLSNAKERLRRSVRPRNMSAKQRKRFPDYRESDSVKIAAAIRQAGEADAPPRGLCRSYDRFRDGVAECCAC
jgi:hypothetical protein